MGTIDNTEIEPQNPPSPSVPGRLLLLVRHGQTSYNVEGRLPGQLAGISLTDEGRRQAQRVAVALSGLPLSAVISSPLERARETAEIIARGWALPVRLDHRLMDTDMGTWAGQKLDELGKADPRWKEYVEHPNQPPEGVESFLDVQARTVAVVEDIRRDQADESNESNESNESYGSYGQYIVLVTHADVVKLILAHYTGLASERARFLMVANASISALAFPPEGEPHLLALNWNALPEWLSPPRVPTRPESRSDTKTPKLLSPESEVADV